LLASDDEIVVELGQAVEQASSFMILDFTRQLG